MMNDPYTTATTVAPENVKYDDKVIKKMIASALLEVDGVLGTGTGILSGITGMLKKNVTDEEEAVSGISASMKDNQVDVTIKVITEAGKNIPTIANAITENVRKTLREVGGLQTKAVSVEIVDTMPRAEYEEKYLKGGRAESASK